MKTSIMMTLLGIYIFAMGVLGMARTASLAPLIISGSMAAVTIWLGWMLGRQMRSVRSIAAGWLVAVAALSGLSVLGLMPSHAAPGFWSTVIFGSIMALSLLALLAVIRWRPDIRIGRRQYTERKRIKGAA